MRLLGVFLYITLTFYSTVASSQVHIADMRLWQQTDTETLRLVLDLNAPVAHKIFTLKSPHRLVIDLQDTRQFHRSVQIPSEQTLLSSIRSAPREGGDLRIVLDLSAPITQKSFLLKPNGSNGHRLIVDIKGPGVRKIVKAPLSKKSVEISLPAQPKKVVEAPLPPESKKVIEVPQPEKVVEASVSVELEKAVTAPLPAEPEKIVETPPATIQPTPAEEIKPKENTPVPEKYPLLHEKIEPIKTYKPVLARTRDIVIAIDAGHGGIDPGAVGQTGIQEKDVVLAIAEDLVTLLKQEQGIRPVLIRKGDYFLSLPKRVELARKYKADLLISIHADAYPDKMARGSSVYMLSRRGASSEAVKWLAERENNADLIGGISLNDKDELLASVLLDLSQTNTLTASAHVGQHVLTSLQKVSKTHYKYLQRAGFIVLRAPDVPSILVEVGFISNPDEELLLNDSVHRLRIAHAIVTGVNNYIAENAPLETLVARR